MKKIPILLILMIGVFIVAKSLWFNEDIVSTSTPSRPVIEQNKMSMPGGWLDDIPEPAYHDIDELFNVARHGDMDAQREIQKQYFNGKPAPGNYDELMVWYQAMSEAGFVDAELRVGDIYFYGFGMNQDYKASIEWYQKSAETGNAFAQQNIGMMYSRGLGVTQNMPIAYMWLDLAVDNELAGARVLRDQIGVEMTPEQLEVVRTLKRTFMKKNAGLSDGE